MGTKRISRGPQRRRFCAIRDHPPGSGRGDGELAVSSDSEEYTDPAAGADSPRTAARSEPEKVKASDRQVGSSKGKSAAVEVLPNSRKQRSAAAVGSFPRGSGDSSCKDDEDDSLKRDLHVTAEKLGDAKRDTAKSCDFVKDNVDSTCKKPDAAANIPTEMTRSQNARQEKNEKNKKKLDTTLPGTCSTKVVAKADGKNMGGKEVSQKPASKGILEFARDVYEGRTKIPVDSDRDGFASGKKVVADKYMKAPSERVLVLGLMAAQNSPWMSKVKPNQNKSSVMRQST